jgi:hypothetical protein
MSCRSGFYMQMEILSAAKQIVVGATAPAYMTTNRMVKNAVIWDVRPRGSCKNRRFGGTYRLHRQGDKNCRARNNVSRNYQPHAHFPPQHRFLQEPYDATSQKTAFFTVTAVKTSNPA